MPSLRHVAWLGLSCAALLSACDNVVAVSLGSHHPIGHVWSSLRPVRADKLDLLIVLDDGPSMDAPLHQLSARAPAFITKLATATPDPITGKPMGLADIHVAVITGSLGSFGTSVCAPSKGPQKNRFAHALPKAKDPRAFATTTGSILSWALDAKKAGPDSYVGSAGAALLGDQVSAMIGRLGADGCAFQQPLEAMYRFLMDPAPYQYAAVSCTPTSSGDGCTGHLAPSGIDHELLRERREFLRPDSMVAILYVSNRNDASLRATGDDWLPWAAPAGSMARGWESCAFVPDDVEPDDSAALSKYGCGSCAEDPSHAGCATSWPGSPLNRDVDAFAVRNMRQTQRYGRNFLWSRDRYVYGLYQGQTAGSFDGRLAPNPLYAGGARTADMVIFHALTGVPEDLVANSDHTVRSLSPRNWDTITSPDHTKRDPRMLESIGPRAYARYKGSGDVSASPIDQAAPFYSGNGGDRDVPGGDDLQYACLRRRPALVASETCSDPAVAAGNPRCAKTVDGSYVEAYDAAYPSLRPLRVAQSLGPIGLVSSICAPSFAPALDALVAKIGAQSRPCELSLIEFDAQSQVPCTVVESFAGPTGPSGEPSCEAINHGAMGYCTPGNAPCSTDQPFIDVQPPWLAADKLLVSVTAAGTDGTPTSEWVVPTYDRATGNVYATSTVDGSRHLVCTILQLTDAAGASCRNDPLYAPSAGGGYCYSMSAATLGPACRARGALGTLRFVGIADGHDGSHVQMICGPSGS